MEVIDFPGATFSIRLQKAPDLIKAQSHLRVLPEGMTRCPMQTFAIYLQLLRARLKRERIDE